MNIETKFRHAIAATEPTFNEMSDIVTRSIASSLGVPRLLIATSNPRDSDSFVRARCNYEVSLPLSPFYYTMENDTDD